MQTHNSETENTIRPQNNGYPAGGIDKVKPDPKTAQRGHQRGVIVAPPSGNTDDPRHYTVLHRGFDMLVLSIQANIGSAFFEYLETERERAEQECRHVLINYAGLEFQLSPYGGKGYRFLVDGGPDGASWAFKKPNAKDKWGIRLTFGSFFLATHGLGAAKAHCEYVMKRLAIRYNADDVSIARADYCVDILANGFELNPHHFVMHSAARRRDHLSAEDISVHGRSGKVGSVTVGGIKNRQVIIYNKRAEVIARKKSHWWDIWNHTLRHGLNGVGPIDRVPLSPDPAQAHQNCVWRVEFRAGKNLLKDTWGIRTWEEFFDRFGDLCRSSGEAIRYTEPDRSDSNRSRWPNHPLWEIVCAEMNNDLFEMRSGADPNPMKEVHREEHIGLLYRNILGCSISLAALSGTSQDGLPKFMTDIADQMNATIAEHPAKAARQLREASERYVFIQKQRNL